MKESMGAEKREIVFSSKMQQFLEKEKMKKNEKK
jgi:hypothetical protein